MKTPIAVVLSIALLAREFPALAAAPDLSEARRRVVAAVHSSDRDVAAAEASLENAVSKAAALLEEDARRDREALAKLLKALKDFKAEKARILERKLETEAEILKAADDYGRACQVLAAVIIVTVAVVVAVFTLGAGAVVAVAVTAAVIVAVAAIVSLVATVILSIPELCRAIGMLLRALGFRDAGDTADSMGRWADRNLTTVFVIARGVSTVVATLISAERSLKQADAAARDAKARLEAASKAAGTGVSGPAGRLPSQPSASFEGDLFGTYHVKLEAGEATRPSGQAQLHGKTAITLKSNPSVKLTLEGDATLRGGPGIWSSLRGQGTARFSGFGGTFTILNATVESQGESGLTIKGSELPVRGCTHTVEGGSLFSGQRLSLAGSLRCGTWSLSASTLKLEGGGVSGGGTFSAWGKSFSMAYSASGDKLLALGSISGSDTAWTRVPGVAAEYRIEKPKLHLKLEGPTLSPTFDADGVRVRTTATKPNGSPWASAKLTFPDVVKVPPPPGGAVPIPYPNLTAPADDFKTAREACEAAARATLFGQARENALAVCRSTHPSPPALPALPNKLDVPVKDIFK